MVAVCSYDNVVVELRFAVWEVQAYLAVGIVGYGLDGGVEEDVVWGEAIHYGVNVGLGAMLEG